MNSGSRVEFEVAGFFVFSHIGTDDSLLKTRLWVEVRINECPAG